MAALLQKSALGVACSARPSMRMTRSKPLALQRRGVPLQLARPQRSGAVQCKAFFNFFTPKPAAPAVDPRAAELVEELISLCSGTDAGSKASPQKKEQIAAAVGEVSKYCIKNPLKSDLLFGEWKVLYSTKPSAVGGPLRSGFGPTVFPGQDARQILEAPNSLINSVEFKTLGVLPGYSRQYGEIKAISGDTFLLSISRGELKAGLGGVQEKEFDIQRKIQILYLDEQLRIARFIPSEELPDDEAGEERSQEEIVFVFQRAEPQAEEAEAEPAVDDEPAPSRPSGTFIFGGSRKIESPATMAERQVRAKMEAQKSGSAKVAIGSSKVAVAKAATAPAKPMVGSSKVAIGSSKVAVAKAAPAAPQGSSKMSATQKGRVGKQPVVEEDPREKRRREAEEAKARKAAEAEAKAAEAKAARERAEAERQAEREKQAAIRELLAELGEELKEKQAAARDALKELKDVEKQNVPALKEVAQARRRIEEAESDSADVAAELATAQTAKKQAEAVAKEAGALVAAAEKAVRAALESVTPKLARK